MITQTFQADKTILKRFARLIQNGRLAHAYLFVGPEGIGKGQTALGIARMINCERNLEEIKDDYCGECSNCLRITSGNHPDVAIVDSGEEPSIKIAKIRELIVRMQLRPYESRKKIFIIKKIEDLTLEGSNALLKTLEEPGKDSLLLLTTAVLEKNLGTIRSRCHTVYFFPQPQKRLEGILSRVLDFLAIVADLVPVAFGRFTHDLALDILLNQVLDLQRWRYHPAHLRDFIHVENNIIVAAAFDAV